LLCIFYLNGCCGTFINLFNDPKVYGGVREELMVPKYLQKMVSGRGGFGAGPVVLMALPVIGVEALFVAITDTAFLPITAMVELGKRQNDECFHQEPSPQPIENKPTQEPSPQPQEPSSQPVENRAIQELFPQPQEPSPQPVENKATQEESPKLPTNTAIPSGRTK